MKLGSLAIILLPVGLIASLSGVGIWGLQSMSVSNALVLQLQEGVGNLLAADRAFHQALIDERLALVAVEEEEWTAAAAKHGEHLKQAKEQVERGLVAIDEAVGDADADGLNQAFAAWVESSTKVVNLAKDQTKLNFARKISFGSAQKAFSLARDRLDALETLTTSAITTAVARSHANHERVRWLMIALGVVSGVITLLLLAIAQRTNTRSLRQAGERQAEAEGLNADLGRTLGAVDQRAVQIASSAQGLENTGASLGAVAAGTSAQAQRAAASAENVSRIVTTVASAAEEMSASIQEIAINATEASTVANEGMTLARQAGIQVKQLDASSARIGDVLGLISDIAEQTNLLALNATIEAARAGEAGRGFAVVASEVKSLATQTAKATGDISASINAMRSDVATVTDGMAKLVLVIERINRAMITIASAVEEQSATTSQITSNVGQAALGAGEIATAVAEVAKGAGQGEQGVAAMRQAVADLRRVADELRQVAARK